MGVKSGASSSSYRPYTNIRRPGQQPERQPKYRVLVHRKHEQRWNALPEHIPLEQAQRFYDHVTQTPGEPAEGIRMTHLRGSAGKAKDGWSKVHHWRVPGSAVRLDYRFRGDYVGAKGDPHPIVRIEAIRLSSH